jgi:carboxylate-amine ligase
LQPWFHRENKWRTARYGLDARVIVDEAGSQVPVREHLSAVLEDLQPVAADLGCTRELDGVRDILRGGASYSRQLKAADAAGGDLHEVVRHLIREFRAGPEAAFAD